VIFESLLSLGRLKPDMSIPTRKTAFIYSSLLDQRPYGENHPFPVHRYHLTRELILRSGLLDHPGILRVECPKANEADLLLYHRRDYLDALRKYSCEGITGADFRYGLGDVENPVFPGLFDWSSLACGGTLEAVRKIFDGECRNVFHMAGGWHHAHPARASGFSYLNDAVIAIKWLLLRGLRVAYIDIDAHHGDGVQEAFYETDRVLTLSLHESGKDFFPQTGKVSEMGRGKGYGYAVNMPFAPHSDDLIFEQSFKRIVLPLVRAFGPDLLVTQMGADSLRTDPLSRLEMTTGALEFAARAFLNLRIPWVALGGGGYDDIASARGAALIWGIMTGAEAPDELPLQFREIARSLGKPAESFRDEPRLAHPDDFARAQKTLEKNLGFLERKLLPLHGIVQERAV